MKDINSLFSFIRSELDWIDGPYIEDNVRNIENDLASIEEYIQELEWELKIKSYSETSLTK